MYLFWTIFGFFFIFLSSLVIYNIYEIYPINKVTNFLNPTNDTTWNKINITIVPILVWSFIELPILGSNPYFLLSVLLNTCISSAIMYVIRYGYLVINKKDNKLVDILSILIGTILGQLIAYITLLLGSSNGRSLFISIIGLVLYTLFIIVLKIWPPKSEFFRGIKK